MPVPRVLSASCGTCVSFESDEFESLLVEDTDKIYLVKEDGYSCIYENLDE